MRGCETSSRSGSRTSELVALCIDGIEIGWATVVIALGLTAVGTKVAPVRTRGDDFVAADDPGRQRRLEWAVLLKRTYAVDMLVCARCQGAMRLVAVIQDERVARRILEHLGLPASAIG